MKKINQFLNFSSSYWFFLKFLVYISFGFYLSFWFFLQMVRKGLKKFTQTTEQLLPQMNEMMK